MNHRFTLPLLCLLLFSTLGWGQLVSKTLHQTFTLDGAEKININVVGQSVEMLETKGSRILCEVTIKLSVANPRLLDYVANTGRYDLEKIMEPSTNELTLSSQKSNNVLMVKGEECQESLSYKFYIPTSVKFANNSTIQNTARD